MLTARLDLFHPLDVNLDESILGIRFHHILLPYTPQALAQGRSRLVQACTDGADLDTERCCRLGVAQTSQVEEQHSRALACWQIVHGTSYLPRQIRPLRVLGQTRTFVGRFGV